MTPSGLRVFQPSRSVECPCLGAPVRNVTLGSDLTVAHPRAPCRVTGVSPSPSSLPRGSACCSRLSLRLALCARTCLPAQTVNARRAGPPRSFSFPPGSLHTKWALKYLLIGMNGFAGGIQITSPYVFCISKRTFIGGCIALGPLKPGLLGDLRGKRVEGCSAQKGGR